MKGFQAIPELLRRNGSTTVFGVLGSSNVPWIADGVYRGFLRLVKTRHEETAVSAAAAFGRVTGGLGVCSATRGPGFANSINPLAAAIHYHLPLLLIVGESPPSKDRSWQVLEQEALTVALGAGFHHAATPEALEPRFWEAIDAVSWNGLPQVLSIGDGVLEADVPLGEDVRRPPRRTTAAPADRIAAAADTLAAAERPLILAGQGALLADCRAALERIGGMIGARLGTTITVNRFFSGHPADIGLVGASAPERTKALLRETDVVLAVGASLNGKTLDGGTLFPNATIIQVEIDPSRERRATSEELHLVGDAGATVEAIAAALEERGIHGRPVAEAPPSFDELADRIAATDIGHDPRRGIDLRALYRIVSRCAPADRIVVTDAGRSRATMAALVDARDARSWIDSMGYGSIGLGLGFAIGAAAAAPGRRVILFTGDVGFMMSSHDLDAVRLNGLDLTIIIRNDEQNGAEVKYLAAVDLPTDIIRQSLPDIPTLARAFGGYGVVVETLDQLEPDDLTRRGLVIVDARIDPELDWRRSLAIGGG